MGLRDQPVRCVIVIFSPMKGVIPERAKAPSVRRGFTPPVV